MARSHVQAAPFTDSSIAQFVDDIIFHALERRASDIHLEPTNKGLQVRYRIDGVLYDYDSYPAVSIAQILSRVKIAAHINISQKRIPQDGKYSGTYKNSPIDVRVSTFPALYGEHIVMRLLQRNDQIMDLKKLGMSSSVYKLFFECINRSSGFFLVTGPTGSGKTTTLYATIMCLNTSEKHIITLEDPVEYNIAGVTQGNIHPDAGFTFERGVRALLRQDPDVAMVGEIRDRQTARIAIESALSGHFILSTLHTQSAPGALMRLIDMGIEPFLVNAAVTGILAQRLARTICTSCKQEAQPTDQDKCMLEKLGISCDVLYEGIGCDDCFGLGYKGRVGIFELFVMSNKVRALLTKHSMLDDICKQALSDGMQPLLYDGIMKVKKGIITLQELMRAVS